MEARASWMIGKCSTHWASPPDSGTESPLMALPDSCREMVGFDSTSGVDCTSYWVAWRGIRWLAREKVVECKKHRTKNKTQTQQRPGQCLTGLRWLKICLNRWTKVISATPVSAEPRQRNGEERNTSGVIWMSFKLYLKFLPMKYQNFLTGLL